MKILIITLGSRGDVQPYVALGKGLQAAGHSVTLNTSSSFESFISKHGLNYGYMSNDFIEFVESASGKEAMESGGNAFGLVKSMLQTIKKSQEITRQILLDSWKTAQEMQPDLIIYHPKSIGGPHMAEKLGIPAVLALPVPVLVPTDEFIAPGFPIMKLGKWFNKLSYQLIHKGYRAYDKVVNEFRQVTLGLEQLSKNFSPLHMTNGDPIPVLHAYSEHVWPRPHDWPETAHITGFWFLDNHEQWQPPADLAAFLENGEPPVYVGFGSMAGRDPQRMAEIVIAALQKAGVRGIIATGWGGLDANNLPESIFKIESVPHEWLFPRVSAVVHHGGAGTTAAGLRAGRPTIVCPFLVDQPYWGARVQALGVGSQPIPQKKLNAENLSTAIEEVLTDKRMRANAQELGEKLRTEDGVGQAIKILEKIGSR